MAGPEDENPKLDSDTPVGGVENDVDPAWENVFAEFEDEIKTPQAPPLEISEPYITGDDQWDALRVEDYLPSDEPTIPLEGTGTTLGNITATVEEPATAAEEAMIPVEHHVEPAATLEVTSSPGELLRGDAILKHPAFVALQQEFGKVEFAPRNDAHKTGYYTPDLNVFDPLRFSSSSSEISTLQAMFRNSELAIEPEKIEQIANIIRNESAIGYDDPSGFHLEAVFFSQVILNDPTLEDAKRETLFNEISTYVHENGPTGIKNAPLEDIVLYLKQRDAETRSNPQIQQANTPAAAPPPPAPVAEPPFLNSPTEIIQALYAESEIKDGIQRDGHGAYFAPEALAEQYIPDNLTITESQYHALRDAVIAEMNIPRDEHGLTGDRLTIRTILGMLALNPEIDDERRREIIAEIAQQRSDDNYYDGRPVEEIELVMLDMAGLAEEKLTAIVLDDDPAPDYDPDTPFFSNPTYAGEALRNHIDILMQYGNWRNYANYEDWQVDGRRLSESAFESHARQAVHRLSWELPYVALNDDDLRNALMWTTRNSIDNQRIQEDGAGVVTETQFYHNLLINLDRRGKKLTQAIQHQTTDADGNVTDTRTTYHRPTYLLHRSTMELLNERIDYELLDRHPLNDEQRIDQEGWHGLFKSDFNDIQDKYRILSSDFYAPDDTINGIIRSLELDITRGGLYPDQAAEQFFQVIGELNLTHYNGPTANEVKEGIAKYQAEKRRQDVSPYYEVPPIITAPIGDLPETPHELQRLNYLAQQIDWMPLIEANNRTGVREKQWDSRSWSRKPVHNYMNSPQYLQGAWNSLYPQLARDFNATQMTEPQFKEAMMVSLAAMANAALATAEQQRAAYTTQMEDYRSRVDAGEENVPVPSRPQAANGVINYNYDIFRDAFINHARENDLLVATPVVATTPPPPAEEAHNSTPNPSSSSGSNSYSGGYSSSRSSDSSTEDKGEGKTVFRKVASTGLGLVGIGLMIKEFFNDNASTLKKIIGGCAIVALAGLTYKFGWADRIRSEKNFASTTEINR